MYTVDLSLIEAKKELRNKILSDIPLHKLKKIYLSLTPVNFTPQTSIYNFCLNPCDTSSRLIDLRIDTSDPLYEFYLKTKFRVIDASTDFNNHYTEIYFNSYKFFGKDTQYGIARITNLEYQNTSIPIPEEGIIITPGIYLPVMYNLIKVVKDRTSKKIKKIKEKLREKDKKINSLEEKIKNMIEFTPEQEGYFKAKEHFEENKNYSNH